MKTRTKIFIAIISIGLVAFIIGMFYFNKKVPGLEGVEPDYVMTSNELFNEFESHEAEATEKYTGKVIAVTGKIVAVASEENKSNITLEAENALIGGVNCSFNKLSDTALKGSTVTIKGRCQGFLMDVVLNNCTLE